MDDLLSDGLYSEGVTIPNRSVNLDEFTSDGRLPAERIRSALLGSSVCVLSTEIRCYVLL